ncbi:CoA-binding protein [Geobacter pelophilus]|uniref:CoA-binding protein n=1 Tax=Geoanaerobacter pelophilus TaxID=60036 RepID=A0AAW4L1V1_9BACT|nr:CoA-binding protein [Geoanaerobacter pelophilus]MBT0664893.1 CoA-binding protein [Geoanaerobacter pelophilus]
MVSQESIDQFLKSPAFGVVGASTDRSKYGNKVLRCYLQNGKAAVPVNPNEQVVESIAAVPSVADLPEEVKSISIITPPKITEKVVEQAILKGITSIWMQPGAESSEAIKKCVAAGINVIADGSCILVVLGYRDH